MPVQNLQQGSYVEHVESVRVHLHPCGTGATQGPSGISGLFYVDST